MPAGSIISDPDALGAFLERVSGAPFLAVDTETTGLDPHRDRVLLIQVGTADQQALIDAGAVGALAVREIFRPDRLVVLHHAKFDLKMLARVLDPAAGTHSSGEALWPLVSAQVMDTMLNEQILRNGRSSSLPNASLGLANLAERYAGMDLDKAYRDGFIGAKTIASLSEPQLRYAERDVEATWKVSAEQLPLLRREGLIRTAAIEGASSWAFAEMELSGVAIEVEGWKRTIAVATGGRGAARARLDAALSDVLDRDLFGATSINYDSDQEVLEAFAKVGLVLETTRREALLATGHPAAVALADYREHQKIVSTYGDRFLEHVNPKTGRIHATFKSIGATTGRSACADPNLQNVPRGSEFRTCFRAPPGRRLITADYSGAELRILAEMSADPVFVRTFQEGGDLHAIVATRVFNRPVSKTENPELRARAKAINFGLAYGMSAGGLAMQLGIPSSEAESLLDKYFRAYPAIRDHLERSGREALRRGWAETLAGRRYWFLDSQRQGVDDASQLRVAKNMPIQGTNADMIKLAMARITRALAEQRLDGFLVNMVHDELVAEAGEGDADRVRDVVVREMTSAAREFVSRVPIEVDVKVSDVWEK